MGGKEYEGDVWSKQTSKQASKQANEARSKIFQSIPVVLQLPVTVFL